MRNLSKEIDVSWSSVFCLQSLMGERFWDFQRGVGVGS